MIRSTQFTKAALLLNEAQEKMTKLLGVPISLSFEIERSASVTSDNVIKVVCYTAEVSPDELKGRSKKSEVCYARFVCFYLMRKYLGMTLKAIGDRFDRDHSTVIAGLEVIDNEPNNAELQELLVQSEKAFLKELRNENKV